MTLHLVQSKPRWGHRDLVRLRWHSKQGKSLSEMARRQEGPVTEADCDLALWALLGRTVPEALVVLNGPRR